MTPIATSAHNSQLPHMKDSLRAIPRRPVVLVLDELGFRKCVQGLEGGIALLERGIEEPFQASLLLGNFRANSIKLLLLSEESKEVL